MKYAALFCCAAVCFLTGCIQVNLPEASTRKVQEYTLVLPAHFQKPAFPVTVSEFSSESPAKFKFLSRNGALLEYDSFSKWSQPPSVMISNAYRQLYGDDDNAEYLLKGVILTFERNLKKKTADLKIQYTLVKRDDEKEIFSKKLESSVQMKGDSPTDFAAAMSQAVTEQAGTLKKLLNSKK